MIVRLCAHAQSSHTPCTDPRKSAGGRLDWLPGWIHICSGLGFPNSDIGSRSGCTGHGTAVRTAKKSSPIKSQGSNTADACPKRRRQAHRGDVPRAAWLLLRRRRAGYAAIIFRHLDDQHGCGRTVTTVVGRRYARARRTVIGHAVDRARYVFVAGPRPVRGTVLPAELRCQCADERRRLGTAATLGAALGPAVVVPLAVRVFLD